MRKTRAPGSVAVVYKSRFAPRLDQSMGGIWLTVDQRAKVDRLLRNHPELGGGFAG